MCSGVTGSEIYFTFPRLSLISWIPRSWSTVFRDLCLRNTALECLQLCCPLSGACRLLSSLSACIS